MRSFIVAYMATLTLMPALAGAQVQNPKQRACINSVNKAAQRLVAAEAEAATECLMAVLFSAQHLDLCATYDPAGTVALARDALAEKYAERCTEMPDFGVAPLQTVASAAVAETFAAHQGLYPPTDEVRPLDWADYQDDPECVERVHRAFQKLYAAKLKEFTRCVKKGLTADTITSEAGISACVAAAKASASTKIAHRVERFHDERAKHCGFDTIYDWSFPNGVAHCRTCAFSQGVHGTSTLCFDEETTGCADTCGNGVVGGLTTMEACDDGNFVDGDGCDRSCAPTGCGNGSVTGSEYCDFGAGRCIGGPYDGLTCIANLECPMGLCTFGAGRAGACDVDCTAPSAGVCCPHGYACAAPYSGEVPISSCVFGFPVMHPCDDPVCTSGTTCCSYGDVCTGFIESACLELEGTLVDCSECAP